MRLIVLVLFDWVDEWLHADDVAAVIFLQIIDIEAYRVALADITYRKEEPLRVIQSVVIEIQEKIVFAFSNAFDFS